MRVKEQRGDIGREHKDGLLHSRPALLCLCKHTQAMAPLRVKAYTLVYQGPG